MTEGVLTRRFLSDPMLDGVSCVVLDEFHERSIHSDLALAFLKELAEIRDDLKIVVMSATLEAEPVSRHLFDAPVIDAEGRAFPLVTHWLPVPIRQPLGEQCELALKHLLNDTSDDGGHILAFLPGAPEIRRVQRHLEGRSWDLRILPLHGSLNAREQDEALAPGGPRRLILATNIAETSLTIEGVTAVIDLGLRKALTHDPNRGVDRLDTVRISRASADQRAGRAGRTGPGRVVRLWDENRHAVLNASDPPEIETADLTSTLLQVLDFHGPDLDSFPFFQPPPEASATRALELLTLLGAIDGDHRLTPKGKKFVDLPLHPRLAAMLHESARIGCLAQGARIGALLAEKPVAGGQMDLLEQVERLDHWSHDPALDKRACRRVLDAEKQLLNTARKLWPDAAEDVKLDARSLARLLLVAYPDRLCRVRASGQGLMVGGRGVSFEESKRGFDFFIALELMESGEKRVSGKVRQLIQVQLEDIKTVLDVRQEEKVVFDETREAVVGVRQICQGDLVLSEKTGVRVDDLLLSEALAREAGARFQEVFQPDPNAMRLILRLRFAARHLSEYDWPDVSESALKGMLSDLCVGKRRFDDVRRLDWRNAILNRLDWNLRQTLDSEAPEKFKVPSGSMVSIDYGPAFEAAGFPVLAVRMQEMFGLPDTPRLAKGRVPVLCHLLAPNMRPAQVTQDLRSFWDRTYAEVRKELRQRYPKHHWPEDPWTAQAVRGAKRRKK